MVTTRSRISKTVSASSAAPSPASPETTNSTASSASGRGRGKGRGRGRGAARASARPKPQATEKPKSSPALASNPSPEESPSKSESELEVAAVPSPTKSKSAEPEPKYQSDASMDDWSENKVDSASDAESNASGSDDSSSSDDFMSDNSEDVLELAATRRRRRATPSRAHIPAPAPIRTKRTVSEDSPGDKAKRHKPQSAVEMMPVFADMRLLISLQPLADATAKRYAVMRVSAPKRKVKLKPGEKPKKGLRERLEGDLTDDESDNTVGGKSMVIDPRRLPIDDVDYSKYSALFKNHPHLRTAWSSQGPPNKPEKIAQPANLKIKLLPFQQEGVWWMSQQESSMFHGGILADEMGMGKTLQTIALLLVNRGKPTMVICPTVALLQWKSEIEAATDALAVFIYYGDERKKLLDKNGAINQSELAKYDVVLTTYSVMETGFRRERTGFRLKGQLYKEKALLHSIKWFRIVLDEAHNIKDRSSNSARAAFELKAERTWSLTGTPLHNRVGELYSLIRLTKTDPFSMYFCHICDCKSLHWNFANNSKHCSSCGHMYTTHFCYWNMHILKPIQQYSVSSDESKMGFKKLGRLLDSIMLRRTKIERAEDMGLPPRIVVTRRDKFNPEEEDFYVSLFANYQREFTMYAQHGTVLNNYANIFELITRMRLAANHPDLLRLKVDSSAKVGADATDTLVCSICNEEAEDPIVSRCKHVFCRVDAEMYVNSADDDTVQLRCPMCYALFDIDLTQPEMTQVCRKARGTTGDGTTLMETMMSTPSTIEYRRSIVNRIDMKRWKSSTKIEALVEELSKHRQANANIKSIVFSQFVNFLDLIQWRLNRAGFSVCRLDGRMSPSQRASVINTFMTHPEYTVFLVSLKAGGVALNLTEASNVYLADCWWNPSVEVQAMDRIHRMGQYRPIKVTRIIIENSIESRIVALQVKKQLLVNSTIGRDKKSLDNLSAQDMQFLFSS
ncbi:DNA repair protein rad16 [Kickxella alabastrina]|uniref:DNA repair protein rad16 n=1 Tax=Kickxella alabastrina TaxID=61397 RepID=A0ACC1IQ73_9FUNG|nr:DNA repair protein rad16 [Kickxella alabastrina]